MSLKGACYIVLIFTGFWSISCTPKSGEILQPTDSPQEEITVLEEELTKPDTVAISLDTIKQEEEPIKIVLVASIEKTACYGKCPEFEAKVYSDGRVLFEGKQHSDKSGLFVAQVTEEWIADIRTYAISLGFFKMADQFPDKNAISDLPNTITFFRHKDVEKMITNNHNAPIELTKIETFFLQKLDALEWQAIIGQN